MFYQSTDVEIKKSNLLTRILVWIREFRFVPYNDARFIFDDYRFYFLSYRESEFLQEFGGTVKDLNDFDLQHPAKDGSYTQRHVNWQGRRHIAKENYVQPKVPNIKI